METPTRHKVFNFEQDFGGIGDGVTLNTIAFQYAIQAAKRYNEQLKDHDKKLRGVELIIGLPSENKTFLTGPFNLTSHFTLTVRSNSIIASLIQVCGQLLIHFLPMDKVVITKALDEYCLLADSI